MGKSKKTSKAQRSWDLAYDLERFCEETGAPDPGQFLARVMAGEDPRVNRGTSRLYDLIKRNAGKEQPDADDWSEIEHIVMSDDRYKRDFVSSEASFQAAQKLMDYLYAKRKSIEVSGHLSASVAVHEPLTREEIELFNETFCAEF